MPIFSWNESAGGVVLASQDGKIVFENTLNARLDVIFRRLLPEVWIFISDYTSEIIS